MSLLLPVLHAGEGGARQAHPVRLEFARRTASRSKCSRTITTGNFPMLVSTNDGGTLEFVHNSYLAGTDFLATIPAFSGVVSNSLGIADAARLPDGHRPAGGAVIFSISTIST